MTPSSWSRPFIDVMERALVGLAGLFLVVHGVYTRTDAEVAAGLGVLGVQGGAFAARQAS